MNEYLGLLEKRAAGELMTPARFFRCFVHNHPAYEHGTAPVSLCFISPCPDVLGPPARARADSKLSPQIIHDLVETVSGIEKGTIVVRGRAAVAAPLLC